MISKLQALMKIRVRQIRGGQAIKCSIINCAEIYYQPGKTKNKHSLLDASTKN